MPLGIQTMTIPGGREAHLLCEVSPIPVPTGILPDLQVDQPFLYLPCVGRAIRTNCLCLKLNEFRRSRT